jgi:indole-3-glycerol phosphate synthase/phosphoribosylanthranilate isomerase/anthranilate synthase/indole-3-glycerol phosphate synthase/phosphoribosylanthranilate isomerase
MTLVAVNRSKAGVVAEIAERRGADVAAELGSRTYRSLADDAAEFSARPGNAPRPIAERLAAPGLHLIAEVKRRSPSVGAIAADADPVAQARAYELGGASAISVLCEPHWFGGSVADLRAVRAAVTVPVLAKEFVVDERQLPVLRAAGADLVLLLASVLPPRKLVRFAELARELNLEPLVEAHDERELEAALSTGARLIGLNNRNLRTLEVDPENCLRLRAFVPNDRLAVGESGVREPRTLVAWRALGVDAALVGEALMRAPDPASAARAFVNAGRLPDDVAAVDRMPLVKICGVTDSEGVLAAVRAGADAIGLNLVPGTPRCLALTEACWLATLARAASAGSGKLPQIVIVVADAPASDIEAAIATVNPDAVQFSGHESPDSIKAIRRPVWKVLHLPAAGGLDSTDPAFVGSVASAAIEAANEYVAAGTARLILDTAGGPFLGGTGRQVARQIAAAVAREVPVILAGGLDASNVAEAVLEVSAIGVDVASGVEIRPAAATLAAAAAVARATAAVGSRPRKDPARVALFVKRARAARFDRPHADRKSVV